jgi:acetyltransferase-like isoleucine patch superfamily enzyme
MYAFPMISGKGRVVIGSKVCFMKNYGKTATILTHSKDATVVIEDSTVMGGLRISCVNKVTIGKFGTFGNSTLIDSDIMPYDNQALDREWINNHVKPIVIADHVWVATNAVIGCGTTLGNECVVSSGAVVFEREFPAKSLIAGNIGRRVGEAKSV